MEFGKYITYLRDYMGKVTQEYLGGLVGRSQSAIHQIETGERQPSEGFIFDLAMATGDKFLAGYWMREQSDNLEYMNRAYRMLINNPN